MNNSITFPGQLFASLWRHLFPGDGDEHGAVIAAGVVQTARGLRFLARDLFIAKDGVDYVPGERGYRMLTADFVRRCIKHCRDEGLAYLAIHNHAGDNHVAFSSDDLASHERGYPALLDIAHGQPVGALVFAKNAVAGDLWFRGRARYPLAEARVLGRSLRILTPGRQKQAEHLHEFDRQARLFGDRGQRLLAVSKVGVIGAGGVGSLVIQMLARLGVGHLVVADPERINITNLPRIVGAKRNDARVWLTTQDRPEWLRHVGQRLSSSKVRIARRVSRCANSTVKFEALTGDFVDSHVASAFCDCDFLFLAADSMQARLVFNAVVHQYLIPGVQMGSKIPVNSANGQVGDVFAACRPVFPDHGCLWCNGVISAARLQSEAASGQERKAWAYVDEPEIAAPSVITLNAISAAEAVNDFLFWLVGLRGETCRTGYTRHLPRTRAIRFEDPRADATCTECSTDSRSRLARGDSRNLPTRASGLMRAGAVKT